MTLDDPESLRSLSRIDLNLLTVFRAVDEYRNVTRAATALGLTQPALSHALNRLRRALGDSLFVKSPSGMVPTPKGETLSQPVREILTQVQSRVLRKRPFSAASLERVFRVRTTDLIECLMLPALLERLARQAPGVQVSVTSPGFGLPQSELQEGRCDLAIAGFFGRLPQGFYQQKIFSDVFLCAVRKQHPRLKSRATLTLGDFTRERHLLIAPGGELKGKVDEVLGKKGPARRVMAGLSSFMASGWVVSDTDLILTGPASLIRLIEERFPVRVLPPPLEIPGITLVQVWHERNHGDPAHRWFREEVRKACSASGRSS